MVRGHPESCCYPRPVTPAHDRWPALAVYRLAEETLRRRGIALVTLQPEGALAHRRGSVVSSSSELCRRMLFSPKGFRLCDGAYTELAATQSALRCPLGLQSIHVPVKGDDGAPLGGLCATGWQRSEEQHLDVQTPLSALTEHLGAPPDADLHLAARRLRSLNDTDKKWIRGILQSLAEALVAFERSRQSPSVSFIATSPPMQELLNLVHRVAPSDATVLIQGESGSGKEVIARQIHRQSLRKDRPLVIQNCAALPEGLLESALFGHVRGAFSGADRAKKGLFAQADGGTLFLDEVGEMSPALQVKLLRVLQDGTYVPVGGTEPAKADVRLIAATHVDLEAAVAEGRFREDLYYRLRVIPLGVPPLRKRPGDLQALLEHFYGGPPPLSDAALLCLKRHRWPGNVRELRAEVTRWTLLLEEGEQILPHHLSEPLQRAGGRLPEAPEPSAQSLDTDTQTHSPDASACEPSEAQSLAEAISALERTLIQKALEQCGGNRTEAASRLGISRTTLVQRLKRYDQQ